MDASARDDQQSLLIMGAFVVFDINEHSVVLLIGPGRLVFICPDFVDRRSWLPLSCLDATPYMIG
jgi:hypothetical protein